MAFKPRPPMRGVLLVAAATLSLLLLLGTPTRADQVVSGSQSTQEQVYDGFTYTIDRNLPNDQSPVVLSLTLPIIRNAGLTVAGWQDNSVRGQYAFSLLVESATITESSLYIQQGIPADGMVQISNTRATNTAVPQPPFDFSAMYFTNNLTVLVRSSEVTLSGEAANQPVVRAGGSLTQATDGNIDYYTALQVIGVNSVGGSCLLSLPGSRADFATTTVSDNSLVSVSHFNSCGLRDAPLCVNNEVVVTRSSYVRVESGSLDACTAQDSSDTKLNRVPTTVVLNDAGRISASQESVVLVRDVVATGSAVLSAADNTISSLYLYTNSTFSVVNVSAQSFCPTCAGGIPNSAASDSTHVYAGSWTINGAPTTDYNSLGLGGATNVDEEGRLANGNCAMVSCMPTYTTSAGDATTCSCRCSGDAVAPSCLLKDNTLQFSNCDDSNCRSCVVNPGICQDCNGGYEAVNGVCQPRICDLDNCAKCATTTTCSSCEAGYGVDSSTGTCVACKDPNCANCATDFNVCSGCIAGASKDPSTDLCQSADCEVQRCQTCVAGSGNRCETCDNGYGTTAAGTCAPCEDPNCRHCDGNTTVCTDCADGTTITQYGTCSPGGPCNIPECEYCDADDATRCTGCRAGYVVNNENGTCVEQGTCLVEHCDKCESASPNRCDTCADGYARDVVTGECVQTNGNCKVAHCTKCRSPTVCESCDTGYSVTATGLCGPANACLVYYCSKCIDSDPRRCELCQKNYGITTAYTCVRLRPSTIVIVSGASAPLSLVSAAIAVALAILSLAL